MNQVKLNNISDEIIDFDDEYSENENFPEDPTPDMSARQKAQMDQKDQIQATPEEEDPDQNDQNGDNIIYDPKVKELNEIDINNKKAIIDFLMNDEIIFKKALKTEEAIKEKNKNKFSYVKPTLITKNASPEPPEKKSLYSKVDYQIDLKEGNPELVKDMNVAAYLLKDQIVEENQDVAKLLFDDITKMKSDKKILTGKQIGEKIKKTLEDKKKHLEKIEQEMYKNQKMQATFKPKINHRKNDGEKRNLNTFLKEQNDFLLGVEKKKQELIIKNETAIKELNQGKPKVNKKSEKLAEKKSGTGPAYMRLYNERTKNKEKIREVEEKMILEQKEEEQKRKEKEDNLRKNNPYKHVKSKINIKQNNQIGLSKEKINNNDNNNNKDNNITPNSLNRGKSAINIMRPNNLINNNQKKKFDYKDIQSNKLLFNKFVSNFDEALIFLGQEEDSKNNETNLEELDENQYHKLLFKLGISTIPFENKSQNGENPINNKGEENVVNENTTPNEEKKLINDSFKLLKLDGYKAKIIDIKNFLICILDLQNYNLYQMFKSTHEQDLKNIFPPDKFKKEEIPELILNKQNEELISKIDKTNKLNNKYFSLSEDNKIIFTLDKFQNIKKDFNIFAFNYRIKRKKVKEDKFAIMLKEQCPFKPEINEKSNKLCKKYKDKVFALQNETVTSNSNSQIKKPGNMDYFDRLLFLDKRRIAENQKIKEEIEKKQIKECTFKPRINNYQMSKKGKKQKEENKSSIETNEKINNNKDKSDKKINNSNKKNKFDELYEDGKNRLKNKISKTREEIELEEQKNECTFQPNIKGLNPKKIPKTNFNNDIYNEKEYKILYERLKHGRLERMVKDSNNDRYGLNNELKQFVKDNKEFNFIQNQQYFDPDDPFYYNNAEINNMMNSLNNQLEQENIEKSNIIKDSINNSPEMNKNENNKLENKDNNIKNNENDIKNLNNNLLKKTDDNVEENNEENEYDKENKNDIPLLIIDVNIRQGVKKKIYVYEGDTSEALAEKFAKEQNLDIETKNKLQSLIHTHMQKLLTRIEEENQSNSEKSQKIHNRKNS